MKKTISIFFIFIAATNFVKAQDGSLDLSFGISGKVLTTFGSIADYGRALKLQSDGKIIVSGSIDNSTFNFAVARYKVNGTLDSTFSADGRANADFGLTNDYNTSCAIQSDGKIILAGYTYISGVNYNASLVRFNGDGSLDNSFDSDGKLTTSLEIWEDYIYTIALQADGKILIAGSSSNGIDLDFAIARLNSDGSFDTSFDLDGKLFIDLNGNDDEIFAMVVQPDNKILIAGYSLLVSGYDFAIVRLNSDGSLDNSFDFDGKATTSVGVNADFGRALTLQADGKILLAGSTNNPTADFGVVRYNTNGSLDLTFDVDGKATFDLGSSNVDDARGIVTQTDGKFVIAGSSFDGTDQLYGMIRCNSDGSLDNVFDSDGIVTTDFGFGNNNGYALDIQTDGKIVVAGESYNGFNWDFSLARYNGASIGIQEINSTSSLNLFPNPSNSSINLSSTKSLNKASIKIIDLTGQVILFQQNASGNNFTFDISNFSNGLYFLEVNEEGNFERVKFVKE